VPTASKKAKQFFSRQLPLKKANLATLTEPLGNIMPWDKNVFCQCCL